MSFLFVKSMYFTSLGKTISLSCEMRSSHAFNIFFIKDEYHKIFESSNNFFEANEIISNSFKNYSNIRI